MASDLERERLRLAQRYAAMSDGELLNIAEDFAGLTDEARSAMTAELSKRGLDVEDAVAEMGPQRRSTDPPTPSTEQNPRPHNERQRHKLIGQVQQPEGAVLVTVAQFRDLPEALIAKGTLDSAGIVCCLLNDNMVRMDWLWSNATGGVRLQVQPDDLPEATQILSVPIPAEFEVDGENTFQQPTCPRCQSLDINFQETSPVAFGTLFLSVPLPFVRSGWRCHHCDFEWSASSQEDDDRT